MLLKNSKVIMYSYMSNPVLPDSDFDGRPDNADRSPLNNEIKSTNQTDNYNNVKIDFNQDYRYFFMDSKSYYEELAEMGLVLSNMASKRNGKYKKWTNKEIRDEIEGVGNYMAYFGMNDIQEYTTGKVPYILGQHDVVGLLGKVNNLERNVITLVIGEDENNKNIIAANYDGALGIDGEYEGDYHHIGYDVEATKIYNKLIEYEQDKVWKKAYWIVGYGTGGSIANLVAKKLIDLKGNREPVFCYTYQAPGTINRNNLTKKIYNVKYQSIFNIENSDDIMLNLMGDDAGWSKYGVIKRLSVGDNKKSKNGWNKLTGQTYKSGSDFLSGLFFGIIDYFKDVFGFSSTYIPTDDTDPVELARAVYAERMREESPSMRQQILELYKNEPQYLIQAKNIDYNGRVADIQATDFTAVDNVFIDEIATLLHDIIEAEQRAKDIERYNKSVETLIEWYTDHIATYRRKHDDTWEDKSGKSHTLYGSDDAENYYKTNVMQELKSTNSAINNLVRKHDSGRYVYYCDDIKKVKGHPWVGDDCTGLMMAIYQLYANEKLQNNSSEVFETNTINNVYTDSFSSSTDNWASRLLRNKANIHIYKVTGKTSVDDLDYGDILICEGGNPAHAEIFIDKEHSWGWGFKHCTKDQDNALGWQCTWLSQYDATRIRYGFVMKDRSVFVKDKDGNVEEYTKSDNRSYNIVLSANPSKNTENIELLFEGKVK